MYVYFVGISERLIEDIHEEANGQVPFTRFWPWKGEGKNSGNLINVEC